MWDERMVKKIVGLFGTIDGKPRKVAHWESGWTTSWSTWSMCTWGNGNLATVRGKARNHENCAEPASATGGRHLYGQCAHGAWGGVRITARSEVRYGVDLVDHSQRLFRHVVKSHGHWRLSPSSRFSNVSAHAKTHERTIIANFVAHVQAPPNDALLLS